MRKWRSRALGGLVVVSGVAGLAAAVASMQRLPSGPVPIAFDREVCAHCHMLIGDPSFAAQIQTSDRQVVDFDDPGCLLAYEAANAPDEHAVYFHEVDGEGWLARDRVAFVAVKQSPMGYDLGAVKVGTPGAMSLGEARNRVLGRSSGPAARSHGSP